MTFRSLLADRIAIEESLIRYARGVDRIDVPMIKSAFWPDATDDHGTFDGRAVDFADYLGTSLRKFEATTHVLSNIHVELEGNIARVESYVTATHVLRPEAGGFRFVVAGRYVDRFERRGDEWRIAARKLVVDWLDVPEEASAIRAHLAQITERGRSSPDDFWYQQ